MAGGERQCCHRTQRKLGEQVDTVATNRPQKGTARANRGMKYGSCLP